nr:aldo/keto reductase [Kitasatospora sp. MBT63]
MVDGVPVGGAEISSDQALALLHRAWSAGIRRIHSSDVYGLGHAERLIGRLRNDLGEDAARELRLSITLGQFRGTASHSLQPVHMRHQLELLNENAGVEELDIISLARVDPGLGDADEIVEVMRSLRDSGWTRSLGLPLPATAGRTDESAGFARFTELLHRVQPDVLAVGFADLLPSARLGAESVREFAHRKGYGLVVHGPLSHGLLTGVYSSGAEHRFAEGDLRAMHGWFGAQPLRTVDRHLDRLRERFGPDPAQLVRLALQYCLQSSDRATVMVGASSGEQVDGLLAAARSPLSVEEFGFVESVYDALCAELPAPATPTGAARN